MHVILPFLKMTLQEEIDPSLYLVFIPSSNQQVLFIEDYINKIHNIPGLIRLRFLSLYVCIHVHKCVSSK